jgi:hypothetical protein
MLKMNLQRAVTYIDRLPLFTRLAIVLMVAAEIVGVLPWWDLKAWGRLEPDLLGLSTSMLLTFSFPHCLSSSTVVLLCGVTERWRLTWVDSVPHQHVPVYTHGRVPSGG